MNLSIRFTDVWQRIGLLVKPYKVAPQDFAPTVVRGDPYGLVLYWPQDQLGWLTVKATAQVGNHVTEFRPGQDGLDWVYRLFQKDFGQEIPAELLQSQNFLAAPVAREATLQLEFGIDTNDEEFCRLARAWIKHWEEQAGGGPPPAFGAPPPQVRTYLEQKLVTYALDGRDSEAGEVSLTLETIRPPKYYDGYVAIDFGTTATTVVCLPGGKRELTDLKVLDTALVRGQLLPEARPTETKVNLEAVDVPADERAKTDLAEYPGAARWSIGALAGQSTDGLVLGAKRLAASPFWNDPLMVPAYRRLRYGKRDSRKPVRLFYRHPAELFISRMFQKFCEANATRPTHLAITYPTTYSGRELRQLKEVVARSWLRMHNLGQTDERIQKLLTRESAGGLGKPLAGKVMLALDEATAAAFFFLSEKIAAPGGMPRFEYLYPTGLNLLLFDCGGGTTDIALVHAKLVGGGPDARKKLSVSVRARSGLRGFGGDNMTTAVYRVFKTKIALALWQDGTVAGRVGQPAPTFPTQPTDAAKAAALIRDHEHTVNQIVPTRFDPSSQHADDRRNREFTLALWDWAEALKHRFDAATGKATFTPPLNSALVKALAQQHGFNEETVHRTISTVTVNAWEVDRLIEEELLQGIRNCNNLIRRRLTEKGEEVHWIVAAGNASRYPLIKDLLLKNLNVLFKDERFTLDLKNLKYAVAKGAALALGSQETGALPITFDSDLSEKLPFDIAYWDGVHQAYRILFAEGQRYTELTKQTVHYSQPVADESQDHASHKVFMLYRRWPGDEDQFEVFGRYYFPNDIQSPVTIGYDLDRGDFTVEDAAGPGQLRQTDDDMKPYRSPPERGDL
jgi:hypothetical protein